MPWRTCLVALSSAFLLMSCKHLPPSGTPTSRAVDSSCRLQCAQMPELSYDPVETVRQLMDWGSSCQSLHDECVASNSDKL